MFSLNKSSITLLSIFYIFVFIYYNIFIPFSQGDGAFEDIAKLLFDEVKVGKIFDLETINNFFENLNYELYYNDNLDNFSSEYFHEDFYSYIYLDATQQKILDLVDFTQSITLKPEEKNIKKLSM